MSQKPRIEEYRIGDHVYAKEYSGDGGVRFTKDGVLLTLEAWNQELNRFQSMSVLEEHPNPLVRLKEWHRRQSFLHLVQIRSAEHVIDVGCESGYLAEGLASHCRQLLCADIDPAMLRQTRRRLGVDKAMYLQADIRALPLSACSLDVVVASEILEHIADSKRGLSELVRIVKPAGHIYLSVPNEPLVQFIKRVLRTLRLTAVLGGLSEKLAIGHVHALTKKDLIDICRSQPVMIKRVFYSKPFFLNVFAHLQPWSRV
jgi:2-polyprenyl-3-methyl-5-hydroxy-6-metoxy-1,4-benzoquinol methylase